MALPVKVRRQHPIGRYIADFAVPARKLVIEIDGGQHATTARQDAARTRVLEAQGWRVIRFWNSDVTENPVGVLETIAAELERTPAPPQPFPPTVSYPSVAGRSHHAPARVWTHDASLARGRRGSSRRPRRTQQPARY